MNVKSTDHDESNGCITPALMSILKVSVGLKNVRDDVGGNQKNMAEEEGENKPVMVQGIVFPETFNLLFGFGPEGARSF